MKNQQGVTLVELLAVLAIVSIVTVAIWTAFSIGTAHSEVETSKTKLQQEANLVIARLRNEHRKNDVYYLQFADDNLKIKTDPTGPFTPITSGGLNYSGQIDGVDFTSLDSTKAYDSETAHTDVVLTVATLDGSPSVTINTKLTRILSD